MNVLTLRVERVGGEPVVRVVVDGRAVGQSGARASYGAAEMLDSAALLPTDPPRRVALAQCECGGGGGCANHTVLITRVDEVVTWSDPRNVHGCFDRPLLDEEDRPEDDEDLFSEPLLAPTLSFDARAYTATVEEAAASGPW